MKNQFLKSPLFLFFFALGACNKGGSSSPASAAPTAAAPTYSKAMAAGQIAGVSWTALHAGARKNSGDGSLAVRIYADSTDVCDQSAISSKPMVTVTLPSLTDGKEFVTDASVNQFQAPLVFISTSPISNDIAIYSKVVASQLTATGFQLALYGRASYGGRNSEVNGTVSVVNCDAPTAGGAGAQGVDFATWQSLVGQYTILSFDGADESANFHEASVEFDNTRFQTSAGAPIAMVQLPLVYSISENSSAAFNFGPMQGLGSSQTSGNTQIFDFSGPIVTGGQTYQLNLHTEVQPSADSATLGIFYSIEIPGKISPTSHKLVIKRM